MKKKVLLAIGNKELSRIFRNTFLKKAEHFIVLENEIYHQDFLEEIIQEEQPDILLLHHMLFTHETEDSVEQNILEFIRSLKIKYDDSIRVTFLCDIPRGNQLLSKLVGLGVQDIFNEDRIPQDQFLEQLMDKPRFANVEKFIVHNTTLSFENALYTPIEEEQIQEEKNEDEEIILIKNEKKTDKELQKTKKELEKAKKELAQVKEKEKKKDHDTAALPHINEDELLEEIPIREKIVIEERIVGAMFVGIVSVEMNTGSTHLSLSLANFLNDRGLKVAVIEANNSNHFFSIEYVYEGGRGYTSDKEMFNIKGIDHYKSIQKLNIAELIHQYDFIILDIGHKENTDYFEEFFRAHIKIVTSHASEWKREKLMDFLLAHSEYDHQNWFLALPFADSQTLEDIEKETLLLPYSVPMNPDPYDSGKDLSKLFEEMLEGYLPTNKQTKKLSAIWLGSGISILVLFFFIIAVTLFK